MNNIKWLVFLMAAEFIYSDVRTEFYLCNENQQNAHISH